MSVYKEEVYELNEIAEKQYSLPFGCEGFFTEDPRNANEVEYLRNYYRDNKGSAKISRNGDLFYFDLDLVEAMEDGRKIGDKVLLKGGKTKDGRKYISLKLQNPNRPAQWMGW
jgi:hypothetical protein